MTKITPLILSLLLALFTIGCKNTHQEPNPSTIKENLINLDLWQNVYSYGKAEVVNDEFHLTSTKNWFYITKKKYKNFILEAEIIMPNVTEYSNAGFIFRAQTRDTKKMSLEVYGYQAEVDPSDRKWSGGFYDQGRRQWLNPLHKKRSEPDADFVKNYSPVWSTQKSNAYKHLEWNKYRVECLGSDIKIYVNNVLTTHVKDVKDGEGYIGIQHHGSKELIKTGKTKNIIKYRNIHITTL